MTSWSSRGPISQAGKILRDAMTALDPSAATRAAPAWGDPSFVSDLFGRRGARVTIEEATLPFDAPSPEAWFEEQERHHAVWRFVHDALRSSPDEWARVRRASIDAVRAA